MNDDDLFKKMLDNDNDSHDELFNDINDADFNTEDDLYNDINSCDDNSNINNDDDDFLDDEGRDEDTVDTSAIGFKEVQLSRKTVFLGIGGVFLAIVLIIGLIAFLVIHNDKPPVAQIVHIESNNPTNKSTAKYGNMITLSFTFNEQIKNTPTVIINGKNVEVTGSGREFKANYFVIEQDYEEIHVEFSIEDYKDSFGKTGDKINNTTDLSKVKILAIGA